MGRKRQWRFQQKNISVIDYFNEHIVQYFFNFVTTPATLSMCMEIALLSQVSKAFHKHSLDLKQNGKEFVYREGCFVFHCLAFRIIDTQSIYAVKLPNKFFRMLTYLSSKPIKKHGIEGKTIHTDLSNTISMSYRHIRESIGHSWKLEITIKKKVSKWYHDEISTETYYHLV